MEMNTSYKLRSRRLIREAKGTNEISVTNRVKDKEAFLNVLGTRKTLGQK